MLPHMVPTTKAAPAPAQASSHCLTGPALFTALLGFTTPEGLVVRAVFPGKYLPFLKQKFPPMCNLVKSTGFQGIQIPTLKDLVRVYSLNFALIL